MKMSLVCLALTLACSLVPACSAKEKTPQTPQYVMSGDFAGAEDLSGLASVDGRHGLIVSDETRSVQAILIDPTQRKITAGSQLPIFSIEGKTEADLEAVAADPEHQCYYAVGSHGMSKKKSEFQEDRCHVFRIPVDPKTGIALSRGITQASLLPWLATQPIFAKALRKPLQERGFNIEGLAYQRGKLYFGVRGPNVDGHSFVIEMAPDALFNNQMPTGKIHELPVGNGQGLRELASLPQGFLVLTGNAGSEPSKAFPTSEDHHEKTPYLLWWWRPGSATSLVKISAVPKHEGKAEGLLITQADERRVEVVVIFDSGKDGAPLTLNLALPN